MKTKLNIIVFFNVIILFGIVTLYHYIEGVSIVFLYIVLGLYALSNRFFLQKIIKNNSVLNDQIKTEKNMSEVVIGSVPSAIIIINNKGVIEYTNPAVREIVGFNKVIGLNILKSNRMIKTDMDKIMNRVMSGETVNIEGIEHVSHISGRKKIFDILCKPIDKDQNNKYSRVMLFMTDITYENYLAKELENQYLNIFRSFVKLIDAKDESTGQHSSNVSKYVEIIINHLELAEESKKTIRIAASLHDIGKVGIDDYILNKQGKLTVEEYDIIKTHSVIGAELLKDLVGYNKISEMIRYHHERWDGKGYPEGLSGGHIPIGAQIIAIADSYDAIISDRVYRAGRSPEIAKKILLEERWKQFNGELVDIFLSEWDAVLIKGNKDMKEQAG